MFRLYRHFIQSIFITGLVLKCPKKNLKCQLCRHSTRQSIRNFSKVSSTQENLQKKKISNISLQTLYTVCQISIKTLISKSQLYVVNLEANLLWRNCNRTYDILMSHTDLFQTHITHRHFCHELGSHIEILTHTLTFSKLISDINIFTHI